MKAVHFLIDMQVTQGARIGYADWTALSRTVCDTRNSFDALGVPTVYPVMISPLDLDFHLLRRFPIGVDSCEAVCDRMYREHGYRLGLDFGIQVPGDALIAPKTTYSGCTSGVMAWLAVNAIDTVFLSGIYETRQKRPKPNTESCVTATAMGLAAAGIKPVIVAEATNIMNDRLHVDPRSLEERARDAKAYGVTIAPLRDCIERTRAWHRSMQVCAG